MARRVAPRASLRRVEHHLVAVAGDENACHLVDPRSVPEKRFGEDRRRAQTLAGRVPYGIRNGSRNAGNADLADTLDAGRINERIGIVKEAYLDDRHV